MNAIFSAAVLCLNISHALPVFVRVACCRSILDTSSFNLGRFGFSTSPILHDDKAAASEQTCQQQMGALAMRFSAESQVAAQSHLSCVAWDDNSSHLIGSLSITSQLLHGKAAAQKASCSA